MGNPLFQKPKNVRYVDMAIWIDKNFYQPDCDENQAFTYMYLLAYMLASKAKYFTNIDDYDGYATHLAFATFNRMKDTSKVQLKSVLNYMKSVMYFRKLSYQNESFAEIIDPVYNTQWNSDLYEEKSIKQAEYVMSDSLQNGIKDIFRSIPAIIKSNIPNIYKNDKLTFHNLYISLLLSTISRFTLTTKDKECLQKKILNSVSFDEANFYRKHLDSEAVILWNIDAKMVPIVKLILNKVKAEIIQEIKEIISDYTLTADIFKDMSNDLLFGDVNSEANDNY